MKSEARLECEKWGDLVTQAIVLDLRLTEKCMFGGRSDKLKRILKKVTKRIERRLQKFNEALNKLEKLDHESIVEEK